jgi:alkylhydroperoxidase family enzyme
MTVDWDIAERHRHVVGDGPRIEPVEQDALGAEDVRVINEVRAAAGAPPIAIAPEYMRTMIRNPAVFRPHMDLGLALFEGTLPVRERELAILRVGWLCGAPYEWGQHVVMARRAGLTDEEIARVRQGSQAQSWSAFDKVVLTGVEELLADKTLSDETWDALAASWDAAQLIEFPMMVGQYVAVAFVQNSLRVRLEYGNTGLDRE